MALKDQEEVQCKVQNEMRIGRNIKYGYSNVFKELKKLMNSVPGMFKIELCTH